MSQEVARGEDSASVLALVGPLAESGHWYAQIRVDKWYDQESFDSGLRPDETLETERNLLVNTGIGLLEDLLIGAGGAAYTTSANAHLAVGTGVAAAVATDTALQTPNGARKVATAVVANQTVTFQATFSAGEGTGAWEEAGTFNNLTTGIMLNRKVQALGTKGAGAVWVLTMNILFS